MPRVVVIVQGEVFRSGACRGPTCMSLTRGSAQGTRVTSGPTSEQIQAFRSIQELAIDHLGALGWNVTTCVDVISTSRQRAELVQSHWASSVAGCGLQVRPQVAATQLEARIEVLDRAEQHLGILEGCAALLVRADLVLKQPLLLPTPRDEEQEAAAGGAIRFPFAMRGTMTGRMQTLLGNPRMTDCFVWVPAAQPARFRGVLAEHRSEAHAHDFIDWWRASMPRAPLPRPVARGLFDADPSKGWNPLFDFANRHCRMPHGLCEQPKERGRTKGRQEGGPNERKPQAALPLVTGAQRQRRSNELRGGGPSEHGPEAGPAPQRRATPPPRLVAAFAKGDSARYFSVVDVGGRSASGGRTRAGEVWLIARRGVWPSAAPEETVVLWPGCTATLARLTQRGGGDESCAPFHQETLGTGYDARSWEPPAVHLGVPHHVAHNLAVTVDRTGALLVAGGQYRARPLQLLQGQLMSEASPGVLAYSASPASRLVATNGSMPHPPRLLLRGDHPGCVERRALFEGRCEFDGRLSLAATTDGRLHLYARANLNVHAGGRHVQVASAASPDSTFGPFSTIRIEGYKLQSGARAGGPEIYYAAVKPNPADGDRSLVGLFPVRTSHAAFIGLAVSCDGVHFSPLQHLVDSEPSAMHGRGMDHPVDGLIVRGGSVHFYVHRDVPGLRPLPGSTRRGGRERQSVIMMHSLPLASLKAFTASWVARSATCRSSGVAEGGGGRHRQNARSSYRP